MVTLKNNGKISKMDEPTLVKINLHCQAYYPNNLLSGINSNRRECLNGKKWLPKWFQQSDHSLDLLLTS